MQKSLAIISLLILIAGCESNDFFSASSESSDFSNPTSKGGSTATFAIKENTLYVVDDQHLNVFDISNENESEQLEKIQVGWGVETIFPFDNMLFLGTQSGVLIYDITSPNRPEYISQYNHIVACDPVVTDGEFAFLTLRTGTACGRPINELQILDLSNIRSPQWINSIPMENPKGLALNGNTLYVCDDGIKVLDVSDVYNVIEIDHIENIPANDVIYHNSQLLVTADDGFYQFNTNDLSHLSHFTY